ncbi:MAG: ABC transporter substrate-binding protein [Methylotenera sp.]|nr:ABC transporter substrate-binding protein [Oligoflexia bacterium]
MEGPPLTLNPRSTLDAYGQRINALVFGALTAIDSNLTPQPELAESWKSENSGKTWTFKIRPGLKDHSGVPITSALIAQCMEEYRIGKPASLVKAGFPGWMKTTAVGREVRIELNQPDPYLPRNMSLIRYFRVNSKGSWGICTEPLPGDRIIGSGRMKADPFPLNPEDQIKLLPLDPEGNPITFEFVRDETTRLLRFLRGESDAVQNAFSLSKTSWIRKNHADRFRVIERDGVNVSYLAFNLKDPVLSKLPVRQAIAHAIDRKTIIETRLNGFGTLAGSFLSPLLPESAQSPFDYDPALSEKLLEEAGYKRDSHGIRLKLKYKTTPVRDGFETAIIFKEMLSKVGVELTLEVIEPAVFLNLIKKGAFQLYSSRWIGVADASILSRTLRSNQPNNRAHYVSKEMDALLDQAAQEVDLAKRNPILKKAQEKMMQDLPYFPLWFWTNAVILGNRVTGLEAQDISLSGGLVPLTHLRVK